MPSKSKSPKSKSPKSKGKGKGSKEKGSTKYLEIPPVTLKDAKRKVTWTRCDLKDYTFEHFRCIRCQLVLDNFQAFIGHCCWRKYYEAKYHIGCTQAFACRICELIFYSHSDYAAHRCYDDKRCDMKEFWQPEDIVPITYGNHQDFYIDWTRRLERESTSHDPDYSYVCRCCNCNNKFKTKIDFLNHSCCMFALLKPARLRRLKTCMHCKYVFLNESQYTRHIRFCNAKAFCIDFTLTATEIGCQQFVIGRHCFDFNYHLHNNAGFRRRVDREPPGAFAKPPRPLPPSPPFEACCAECGFIQPNLVEFYYHPCVAGKRITPANLELTLYCCDCQCLFPDIFDCIDHFKSCATMKFSFVRLNTPELIRVALRRWSRELSENPYLPARQVKFRCGECEEICGKFQEFLEHPCPKRERYERLFIQPLGILETYSCEACHLVVFSVSESLAHSKVCTRACRPHMFQVHYCMDEVVSALTPWMRCPQILEFNVIIGIGEEKDERELQDLEFRQANRLPEADVIRRFHDPENKPSKRVERWIINELIKKATPNKGVTPRLRNIPHVDETNRLNLLKVASRAENCKKNAQPKMQTPVLPSLCDEESYNPYNIPSMETSF